jgi:hypothetical protein
VSPVKFELVFYIPEDGILHSHRRENLRCYIIAKVERLYFSLSLSLLPGGLAGKEREL